MSYVTAKSMIDTIQYRFNQYGFPLEIRKDVILPDDPSTLFTCSGMQPLKPRFRAKDGTCYGSIQPCIRTKDLDLVGDGTHLTYFEMIGNFSFGGKPYGVSLQMWSDIVKDLKLPITHVTYHPSRTDHRNMIESLGWRPQSSIECEWSDGDVGGNCCEFFINDLEVGNLVNPMGHSTDVGFGLERMLMIMEGKSCVDETSLFNQDVSRRLRDHHRTLGLLWDNKVSPGNKGRNYICRRLLRRVIDEIPEDVMYFEWVKQEKVLRTKNLKLARKLWKKFKDKDPEFWWQTFGVLPEEIRLLA